MYIFIYSVAILPQDFKPAHKQSWQLSSIMLNIASSSDSPIMSAPAPQALIISTNAHYDVETGDLISSARIQEITNRLVEAGTLMDASQKTWIDEIKSNGGDKSAGATVSNQVLPGGKTRLLDQLSRDKCVVNLLIIGPPVILEGLTEK